MSATAKETGRPEATPLLDAGRSKVTWRFKEAVFALSLANLCLIQSWFSLLFNEDFGYFNKISITRVVLGTLALNLLCLAVFFWMIALLIQRTRHGWLKFLGHSGLCLLLLIPLNFFRLNYLHLTGAKMAFFYRNPLVLGVGLVLLVVALRWHRQVSRILAAVVIIFTPLIFFTVAKLAAALVNPAHLALPMDQPFAALLPVSQQNQPRVLWIIMDEMDQRMTFAERPAGIQLPEMDRFRQQSLFASNAFSPTCSTITSIPSLTSGQQLASASPANASDLLLRLAGTREVVSWSKRAHVFSRARALGFNSGIAGWFHPYSRLFPEKYQREIAQIKELG